MRHLLNLRKLSLHLLHRIAFGFFEELRVALKNNPQPAVETALMAVFDRIGLGTNEGHTMEQT